MYMYSTLPHGAESVSRKAGKKTNKLPALFLLAEQQKAVQSEPGASPERHRHKHRHSSKWQHIGVNCEISLLLKLTAAGPAPWLWSWVGVGLNDGTGGQTLVTKTCTIT